MIFITKRKSSVKASVMSSFDAWHFILRFYVKFFEINVFLDFSNFAIWEVLREEEFSPLKNADDAKSETPTTCRMDLSALHTKWLVKAGAIISENSSR